MLKRLCLVALLIAACGPKNPDCPSCPNEPTPTPAPPTPPQPPTPPVPPPPPEPTDKKVNCYLKWDLEGEPADRHFVIFYNLVYKVNKEVYAALRTEYHAGDEIVQGSEASKTYKADEPNSGEVSTFVWQASIKAGSGIFQEPSGNPAGTATKETVAKIKSNVLNETREVVCE